MHRDDDDHYQSANLGTAAARRELHGIGPVRACGLKRSPNIRDAAQSMNLLPQLGTDK
jgi:hypothetical protein